MLCDKNALSLTNTPPPLSCYWLSEQNTLDNVAKEITVAMVKKFAQNFQSLNFYSNIDY